MKVILNQTVPKVGKEGQIVNVADGYARNYLFPKNLAIYADKTQIAILEKRKVKIAEKTAHLKDSAEVLKGELDGKSIRLPGKVGKDSTKLFGAITAQDIVDAIKAQLHHEIERKKIALIEPIKRLGTFPIHIDLHHEVDLIVNLEVFDPGSVVVAAPEPETTEV